LIWLPKWMLGVGLNVRNRNVWWVICLLFKEQFTKMCPLWFRPCELHICTVSIYTLFLLFMSLPGTACERLLVK
jgi:hypothetical protein